MIVVDTNILAYLYLPGDYTAHAEAMLERDPDWAAPVLWRSEFRNILSGYMRRGPLTFEQARDLQAEAESLLTILGEDEVRTWLAAGEQLAGEIRRELLD